MGKDNDIRRIAMTEFRCRPFHCNHFCQPGCSLFCRYHKMQQAVAYGTVPVQPLFSSPSSVQVISFSLGAAALALTTVTLSAGPHAKSELFAAGPQVHPAPTALGFASTSMSMASIRGVLWQG